MTISSDKAKFSIFGTSVYGVGLVGSGTERDWSEVVRTGSIFFLESIIFWATSKADRNLFTKSTDLVNGTLSCTSVETATVWIGLLIVVVEVVVEIVVVVVGSVVVAFMLLDIVVVVVNCSVVVTGVVDVEVVSILPVDVSCDDVTAVGLVFV